MPAVSALRTWIPLVSIGVTLAGFVVALWVTGFLSTPEYEHATYLHDGLIWLAWSFIALAGLALSFTSLRRNPTLLSGSLRPVAKALNIVVVIIVAGSLPFSVWSLVVYRAGIVAYDTAVQRCGRAPVLAMVNIMGGKDVLLPTDSDYERLKYSAVDPLLGSTRYYCSLAEAEADGYQRLS